MRSEEEIRASMYSYLVAEKEMEQDLAGSPIDIFSVAVMVDPVFKRLIQTLDQGIIPLYPTDDGFGERLPFCLSVVPADWVIEYWVNKGIVVDAQEAEDRLRKSGWDGEGRFYPPPESE